MEYTLYIPSPPDLYEIHILGVQILRITNLVSRRETQYEDLPEKVQKKLVEEISRRE